MTKQQIEKSLQVLAPSRSKRDECRRDIEHMIDWVKARIQAVNRGKRFVSKQGKASLRRYRKALYELQNAYNAFDPAIKPWFSLAETAQIPGTQTVIERELAKVEPLLAKPSPKPQPDAVGAKSAVLAAYSLLVWWGHKPKVTRGGDWEELAKALAGDQTYVFEHMRSFRRNSERTFIDKVKYRDGVAYVVRVWRPGRDMTGSPTR